MSMFLCVVLSCVSTGLAMGRSSVQEVLHKCLKQFRVQKLIQNRNRPEDLIRETHNKYLLKTTNLTPFAK
jgi:hypothetical protein